MTENGLEKRYKILTTLLGNRRNDYVITLQDSFIKIRNDKTSEGIYTDDLQKAKRWILKDINK